MKKRILSIALTLAILGVLLLSSTVQAAGTPLWGGTTVLQEIPPVSVTLVTADVGTWDNGTNTWNIQFPGAGVAHLTVHVKNNNATTAYTVGATLGAVSPTPTSGTIIPAWNTTSKWMAGGSEFDFILTVTASADVPIILSPYYSFTMNLTY